MRTLQDIQSDIEQELASHGITPKCFTSRVGDDAVIIDIAPLADFVLISEVVHAANDEGRVRVLFDVGASNHVALKRFLEWSHGADPSILHMGCMFQVEKAVGINNSRLFNIYRQHRALLVDNTRQYKTPLLAWWTYNAYKRELLSIAKDYGLVLTFTC